MVKNIDDITGQIVDAAVQLHYRLGPGLLESVYHSLLVRDLQRRGLHVDSKMMVQFEYDGIYFHEGLRLDILVESSVIVELKSVEALAPVHFKQLLTYLRLLGLHVGLLINFGGATMKEGLRRVVNRYEPDSCGTLRGPA